MMKKNIVLIVVVLMISLTATGKRIGLKFDMQGNMISPDDYLVHQALIDDEDGYKNDAMWRLKEAAEYGNKHGQYYAGLLHLQKNDYVNGYAWLKLAGDQFMNTPNLLPAIEQRLRSENLLEQAKTEHQKLNEKINFESSIAKRVRWFKKIKFGGTHIGGYVPIFWQTELKNGVIVKSNELRNDINQFIFQYRYQRGDVRLKELTIEDLDVNL